MGSWGVHHEGAMSKGASSHVRQTRAYADMGTDVET